MPVETKGWRGLFAAAALGLAAFGCKAKAKPPAAAPSAVSSAKVAAPETPERCRSLAATPSLRVGDAARPKSAAPDDENAPGDHGEEDDEAALPFAARVDAAVALDDTFAVGGLSTPNGKTEAFVGWVPLDGGPGRRVELGQVHGDVDPPLVAGRGRAVVAAVADMDAGGGMLTLHRLEEGSDKPTGDVSLTGVEHDAGAALALGEHGALVVWGAKRGRRVGLKALAFDPAKLEGTPAPRELEGTLDAESPALVTRPGGYWLSWIAEAPATEHADAGSPNATPDAGARSTQLRSDGGFRVDAAGSDADDGRLVESGPRVLMALALDGSGKALATPRNVSGPRSHVVGFEAALLPDGALSLAFREDDASPGVESGPPDLARVTLDGAVEHAKIEDEDLSAGLPALMNDEKPGGRLWVALEGASGGTRVGWLKETGLALESLVGDRLLRGADVLAVAQGRLLVGKNRGRAIELEVLECKTGP